MPKVDDSQVFEIDEGFGGQRISVRVLDSADCGGGGFVQFFERDREACISIDFDVFDRITKAVAKKREI